jgi:hypothetical protein
MRKCLMFLMLMFVLIMAAPAGAVDLAWDHDDPSSVSIYSIYYSTTEGSSGQGIITVSDGMVMTVSIPESHFQPNVEYTIYATAYNLSGESGPSNSVTYMRTGWGPPVDMPPIKLWIKPGNPNNLR